MKSYLLLSASALALGCRLAPADARPSDAANCQLVSNGSGAAGTVPVRAEIVASGLEVPWGIAFLPNGDLLVTERPGRIRIVRGGDVLPPVATIAGVRSGEGGLLGIALHPSFSQNHLFYAYVSQEERGRRANHVERWRLADDERSATRDRVILSGIAGAEYHDGGRLRFGPDGMLYVGTGDAGEPESAQSLDSLNGKLLRLTPDGAVPPDNPFPGKPIWIYGIRNTQGFDWLDARTLVLTDHGPSGELGRRGHDEVNIAHPGDNLGWPEIFGCEARPRMNAPVLSWTRAVPPGGAALYTGNVISEWKGNLIIGVLGAKHLHRVVFEPGPAHRVARHEVYFQGDPPSGFGRLRDVVMSPDGQLYVTTSNCDGRGECGPNKDAILRITR